MSQPEAFQNRLSREKSPYLLQHASNPVDWYPWGSEALEKARKENKLIFLSIGYSTCHWCHVMEEESFTNPGVAGILNDFYVSIKVDREERPDIDHSVMEAVMAMTGSGGWPLSAFLTPDLEPFFGGTYFPPDDRYGRPGFVSILLNIAKRWEGEEKKIRGVSKNLAEALRSHAAAKSGNEAVLDSGILLKACREMGQRYDGIHGGFGTAPKFPSSHMLSFLLAYGTRSGDPRALEMTEKTLSAMARGGIYDALGGGFHRYSTDERWHVPHFEKMLYDQALLARTYTEAFQATGNPAYEKTAREILDYVLRELTHPDGGFYSAEDADSAPDASRPQEKTEGAFYVWDAAEIKSLLDSGEADVFSLVYGVKEEGNVEHDPFGEFVKKNVLFQALSLEQAAVQLEIPLPEALQRLTRARQKLLDARGKRPRPHLDDKILTDWNGLMISAFAFAARVFSEPRYESAARRAMDFVLANCRAPGGRLLHRWREGEAAVNGFLDDYAFLLLGLFELYETGFRIRDLETALALADTMKQFFWDEKEKAFFFTPSDGEVLLSRQKTSYDGAMPSGNSMAVHVLSRLGRLLQNSALETLARDTLAGLSGLIQSHPAGYPTALTGFDFLLGPAAEVVIAGNPEDPQVKTFLGLAARSFDPRRVVLLRPVQGSGAEAAEKLMPFLKSMTAKPGEAVVYFCRNFTCETPVTGVKEFQELLERFSERPAS